MNLVPAIVRGRLTEDRADGILSFWARHGALEGDAARQRLAEVVAVLVDRGSGEVVGVNSVYDERVALVGNRRFWLYRRFAPGIPEAIEAAFVNAAFDALEDEFTPHGPIGLCLRIDDPDLVIRRREAVWPETDLSYAGYDAAGSQIRIRYFAGARV